MLRRAVRLLPEHAREVFEGAGASSVTELSQVGGFADLIVAGKVLPEPGTEDAWFAALHAHATRAMGDEWTGHQLVVQLQDASFRVFYDVLGDEYSLEDDVELEYWAASVLDVWIAAATAGYATPDSDLVAAAMLGAHSLALGGQIVPASDLMLQVADWCRNLVLTPFPMMHVLDADALTAVREARALAAEVFTMRLLVAAGRMSSAVEFATTRSLLRRVRACFDDDPEMLRPVYEVLRDASAGAGQLRRAIAAAEWLFFDSECRFGPAATSSLEAARELCALLLRARKVERAFEVAEYAHGVAVAEAHPVQRAYVAIDYSSCLLALGRRGDAAAVAHEAVDAAVATIGTAHPAAEALRLFVAMTFGGSTT